MKLPTPGMSHSKDEKRCRNSGFAEFSTLTWDVAAHSLHAWWAWPHTPSSRVRKRTELSRHWAEHVSDWLWWLAPLTRILLLDPSALGVHVASQRVHAPHSLHSVELVSGHWKWHILTRSFNVKLVETEKSQNFVSGVVTSVTSETCSG